MKDARKQLIGLMSINGGIYHHSHLPERYRMVANLESSSFSFITANRLMDVFSLWIQYVLKRFHRVP